LKVAIERVQILEIELNMKVEENATLKQKLAKTMAEMDVQNKQAYWAWWRVENNLGEF
jgi:hypothetical protein